MCKNKKSNDKNGITLIALIITIIIMLILVSVTVKMAINGGLFEKAGEAKQKTEIAREKEEIQLKYMIASGMTKNNKELFEQIRENLNWEDAEFKITSISLGIKTKSGREYTVLEDGTIIEGKVAYLDIADGSIDLYSNGYKQGKMEFGPGGGGKLSEELIPYTGNYVITGTTTENLVRVCDVGTYNITIKNLTIDVSTIDKMCAFNANKGVKATNCFVNITLEGENKLCGGLCAPGLGFARATPNVDGVTNGSTLIISGNGKLEAIGGNYSAGIGSGYTGFEAAQGDANNIIINSGTIVAKAGSNGCAIGGGLRKNVNNIVINGGNITAIGGNRFGIGASATVNNLIINGGIINATGGAYGGAIGGYEGSGKITINGGIINATSNFGYATIGNSCETVEIRGGTIICNAKKHVGIYGTEGSVNITGGSIFIKGLGTIGNMNGTTFESDNPKNGINDLYVTPIQLQNLKEKVQITSLITSDNLDYGITDIYTSEDDKTTPETNEGGILYLYLPAGNRTITIVANGKTYSGTVVTSESNSTVVLNQK